MILAKQERTVQERIRKALTGLAIRPPIGDIKPLKGQGKLMRLRVGTYNLRGTTKKTARKHVPPSTF